MYFQAWGVCSLLLGVVCREAAAADAVVEQSDPELPFWSIILISLACILVMAVLGCLLCTICVFMKPKLYPRNNFVRYYFPHLAFWGYDVEPSGNVP